MMLEDLKQLEEQMEQLDGEMATLLEEHQDVVRRLAEVPGLGVSSAVQIMADLGPRAEVFDSAKKLSSWVGVCPGSEEVRGSRKVRAHPRVTGTCGGC
jgi:transposase